MQQSRLVLTGRMRGRRHVIELNGVAALLTDTESSALCELAAARVANTGPVQLNRTLVHRLKLTLGRAAKRTGIAETLVYPSPVAKKKYEFAIPGERIVAVESISEVALSGCVDRDVVRRLVERAG